MQLTFISDTHALHRQLQLGSGEVLVHCGDFTKHGDIEDVEDFAQFIAAQDFKHKIVIAGNHDWCFEDERRLAAEECLNYYGIYYLNDLGIELEGVKFWGSPIQPAFSNWAFNRKRGEEIRRHWDLIPKDTDILLTHGPAFGILDECYDGVKVGCEVLLEIVEHIQPKIHAFGHIHEEYGVYEYNGTIFVNACSLDEYYNLVNPPIVLSI